MTETIIRLLLMILIGGFIGYITNKLAIKMLFRPVNPINLGLFTLQGVFPKRKDQMAESLADTIERELLSKDVLASKLLSEETISDLKIVIKDTLVDKVSEMLPPMVKMFLGEDPKGKIRKILDKDGDRILDELFDTLKEEGLKNLSIHDIVKERIDTLDFIEFERIIFGLMNRELRFVEIIGLFLGGLIGILQFLVTTFIV